MELKAEDVTLLVIHCSATREGQDIRMEDIDRMHRDRGWSMCGYHTVICRDGAREAGRPLDRVGAHAKGVNTYSASICMVGGLTNIGRISADGLHGFTDLQHRALEAEVARMLELFPNIADICGHRDLSPDLDGDGIIEEFEWTKACPTFDVRAWARKQGFLSADGEVPRVSVASGSPTDSDDAPEEPAPPRERESQSDWAERFREMFGAK